MDVLKLSKKYQEDMVKYRRDLHQIPELNLNLPKTIKYVTGVLKELKIEHKLYVNNNAIVATINGKNKGKCFAIRADMDALPIKEETNLPFSAKGDNMHACGHDSHTAIALGVAKVLSENPGLLDSTLKILFQPGEEYPGGAKPMIDEGALEGVDAIVGIHNGFLDTDMPLGSYGFKYDSMMASMDRFYIKVIGKGSHGAYPQLSIDPIVIGSEIVLALQKIVSREIRALDSAVVSVCQFHGGFSQNIIPESIELEGTVRTFDNDVRNFISKRIQEIAIGIAKTYNAKAEVVYDFKYPPLINSNRMIDLMKKSALEILGEKHVHMMPEPVMGGEDMAYFLEKVEGAYLFLANPSKIDGQYHSHHNCKFDIDESYFYKSCALYLQTAINYFKEEKR